MLCNMSSFHRIEKYRKFRMRKKSYLSIMQAISVIEALVYGRTVNPNAQRPIFCLSHSCFNPFYMMNGLYLNKIYPVSVYQLRATNS